MYKKKRGQITIFIIVGIILLTLVSILLYVKNLKEDVIVVPEIVPQEFTPVTDFVRSCIEVTMRQGINIMGQQGGYIYYPESIALDPRTHIKITGNILVPYWYLDGKNNAPTRENMDADLTRYMNENLPKCINNFDAFKENFEMVEEGPLSVKSTVGRTSIISTLHYPIKIILLRDESSFKVENFEGMVELEIQKILDLAVDILNAENAQMFLEDTTINLMALTPSEPRDRAIPFNDIEFSCGQIKWSVANVEEQIKRLLFYNLPRIRVENTDYAPIPADDKYARQNFLWYVSDSDYEELKANVYFDTSWDFNMQVRPSQGGVMKSSMGKASKEFLSMLCLNIYHFTYDLVYPVQIVIQDDKAFNGRGYTFRYAFPVLINHNQGDRENFGISRFDPVFKEGDYCGRVSSETFTIYTKDANTYEDIKDINITYNCADSYYCDLGKTQSAGQTYSLRTNLPSFCTPGAIEAEGEFNGVKYYKEKKTINPDTDYLDIYLTPIKELKYEVQKHRTNLFENPEYLEEGEKAFIYLTTDDVEDYDFYGDYPQSDNKMAELLMKNITYQLYIVLTDEDDDFIGGYKRNWTVAPQDLDGKSRVVFKVVEYVPKPTTEEEEGEKLLELENISIRKKLDPVLI